MIRIEIEGMKQSIVHAILERQLMMDEWVQEAVEAQTSEEQIKATLNREVSRALEATVREEVDRFYRHGGGRKLVAAVVASHLQPRLRDQCPHFHTVNHHDNPRSFDCLDCGTSFVDLGNGYEPVANGPS